MMVWPAQPATGRELDGHWEPRGTMIAPAPRDNSALRLSSLVISGPFLWTIREVASGDPAAHAAERPARPSAIRRSRSLISTGVHLGICAESIKPGALGWRPIEIFVAVALQS
jgi:hypothetical protein